MPESPNPNWQIIVLWGQAGILIKKLRMDNAGVNIALEKRLKSESWKNPVEIEYTARDTPQRKSLAEVAFYALANKARAAMHHANLPM